MEDKLLIKIAMEAREKSYSPYSNFKVVHIQILKLVLLYIQRAVKFLQDATLNRLHILQLYVLRG